MFYEDEEMILRLARDEVTMQAEPLAPVMIRSLAGITNQELDYWELAFDAKTIKDGVEKIRKIRTVSIPQAISLFIDRGARVFHQRALIEYAEGDYSFLVWHDFAQGMRATSAMVKIAEDDIAGKTDRVLMKTLEELEARGLLLPTNQLEFYLNITAEIRKWGDLLMNDHTGFNLIDGYVDYTKTEMQKPADARGKFAPRFQTADFFLMGVKFGADLYKDSYQIVTGQIPDSKS